MIRIENVSHSYGHAPILRDVSLTLEPGGVTALVGPNGAGKSTLLGLIARLIPLQQGRIRIGDLTIGECPTDVLARRLAILPQISHMAPRLTVRELIGFGRYPHHKGRPSATDHARVEEAIDLFALARLAHRPLDTLSGGQRQRALVAMTFAQDTDTILLDEPLNNLDIAASRSLMQLLTSLAHDHGRSVVIVLHDLNYASRYADHIVAMAGGRVIRTGPQEEIVTDRLLSEVFATDATVAHVAGRPVVTL